MQKIILFKELASPELNISISGRKELVVKNVNTVEEIVRNIVREPDTLCIIASYHSGNTELEEMLGSLLNTFPLLTLCTISEKPIQWTGARCLFIPLSSKSQDKKTKLIEFIKNLSTQNKRAHHRFSWPLKAQLRIEDKMWKEFSVYSLSAGGAYLESKDFLPEPNREMEVNIVFQNCKLVAHCRILDIRQASSTLPYGFAVEFVDLTEKSKEVIDSMVNDALLGVLLEHEEVDEIPSLVEDEMTFQFEIS